MTQRRSSLNPDGSASDWFCDAMKDFTAAYPHFKVAERQTRVYAAALADLTEAEVRSAMGRAIIESKYFPSVAELRQFLEPSSADRAEYAWLNLRTAVREIGAWSSCIVDDACAAVALKHVAGSWPKFCEVDDGPGLMVMRQGFLSSYREARRRLRAGAAPVRLAGLCEITGNAHPIGTIGRVALDGQIAHEAVTPQLAAGTTAPLLLDSATDDDVR